MPKYIAPRTPLGFWLAEEGRQRSWLARKLGIDASLVSRWATGDRVPRLEWRQRIEEITLGAVSVTAWPDAGEARAAA